VGYASQDGDGAASTGILHKWEYLRYASNKRWLQATSRLQRRPRYGTPIPRRNMPDQSVEDHLPLRPVEFEILVSLGRGPRHGYAILQESEERGEGVPGLTTLYRALQRMAERGLIEGVDTDADDRRRDVYALTALGRRVAEAEARRLEALLGVARAGALLGPGAGAG
jgi:DNA-binding PadR family transcriptional regulator